MIRTGDQYRDSIRDGREVYIDGEKVKDVTTYEAEVSALQLVGATDETLTLIIDAVGERQQQKFVKEHEAMLKDHSLTRERAKSGKLELQLEYRKLEEQIKKLDERERTLAQQQSDLVSKQQETAAEVSQQPPLLNASILCALVFWYTGLPCNDFKLGL